MSRKWLPSTFGLTLVALPAMSALITSACPEVGTAGVPDSALMQPERGPARRSVREVRIEPAELILPSGAQRRARRNPGGRVAY